MTDLSTADPERLIARVAAHGLVIQGLLERLILAGVLDAGDLAEIEAFGQTIAKDLQGLGSTAAQVDGARVADELRSFMGAMRPE